MRTGILAFSVRGMQLGERLVRCFGHGENDKPLPLQGNREDESPSRLHGDGENGKTVRLPGNGEDDQRVLPLESGKDNKIAHTPDNTENEVTLTRCPSGGLADWTRKHFHEDHLLIFIGSCGIAVRAIAPFAAKKTTDPAVVVIDEKGTFCVSLLSGHLGGANTFTGKIAAMIGATPVITTATDVNSVFAIDTWAADQDLFIANPDKIKAVSSRLLNGETIRLRSDFPIEGTIPEGLEVTVTDSPMAGTFHDSLSSAAKDDDKNAPAGPFSETGKFDVVISARADHADNDNALLLVPPVLALGIGTKRGVSRDTIEALASSLLNRENIHPRAIFRVCSIDRKADEPGILAYCAHHALPFRTFSPEALASLEGDFSSSGFVRSVTGVDNVCERSAVLGCGDQGKLLCRRLAGQGVTLALAGRPITLAFDTGKDACDHHSAKKTTTPEREALPGYPAHTADEKQSGLSGSDEQAKKTRQKGHTK